VAQDKPAVGSAAQDPAAAGSAAQDGPGSRAVTRNVFILGAVSFCADVASDMVVPLLPAFLLSLGAGASFLGAVEGLAEATAALFKWLSGRWADQVRRLLPLTAAGYALAAAVRPLLALAAAPWQVLAVRCLDRVGKGVRSSPRDKLLAASAPEGKLAEAFSFHRAMDHAGAALGPLAASALLLAWPGQLRRVFLVAAVPGALAALLLVLVREKARPRVSITKSVIESGPPRRVPPRLLAAIGVFALGNSTDALLLLRAQALGVATAQLPLLWMLLHAVRSLCSWPLGRLADRLGRQGALAAGWIWYAACYTGFASAHSALQVTLLFAAYGLVAGLTEGSERALVAAAVGPQARGRALGLYSLASGAGLLIASVLAGALWDRVSPAAALGLGAVMATLAAALLAVPLPASPSA
jgi:MFS family permease